MRRHKTVSTDRRGHGSRHAMRGLGMLALATFAASGCIRTTPSGPDLGTCADPPRGNFTFGEIGIGTCLSGPNDLQFVEKDGTTWLAVTNANPYQSFTGGNFLMIDTASIDRTASTQFVGDLDAYAIDTDPFVGDIAIVDGGNTALVTGRFSEDAFTRAEDDFVFVFDITDPTNLAAGDPSRVEVGQDPGPIVSRDDDGQAWVVNATGHTVTVLDTSVSPIAVHDPGDIVQLSTPEFDDADDSDSTALLDVLVTSDVLLDETEVWTLTWVEGTTRAWLPEEDGLLRWTTGDDTFAASEFGVELSQADFELDAPVNDPWIATVTNLPLMLFAANGDIFQAATLGTAAEWSVDTTPVLDASDGDWDAILGSPSLASIEGLTRVYYDGRTADGASAAIGVATSADGITFTRGDAILTAPTGIESLEHPSVLNDDRANAVRIWMSMWDGATWTIGLATSTDDGDTWDAPEQVLAVSGGHAAAPIVTFANARYTMWFTHFDGADWTLASATSFDGIDWSSPATHIDLAPPADVRDPIRAGIQSEGLGVWRIEGLQAGVLDTLARDGTTLDQSTRGWTARVANGQEIDENDVPNAVSLEPGSLIDLGGTPTLYASTVDEAGERKIAALQETAGVWETVLLNAIPTNTGGNVGGVQAPVVFEANGSFHLLYAAQDDTDTDRIRHAMSDDGLNWTPTEGASILPSPARWESAGQLPHSVEVTADGFRLWYSGFDGTRFRIGSATSTDGLTWTPEPGASFPYQFDIGTPGSFDDTSVRDPLVIPSGDTATMWYAASDGNSWTLGRADRDADGIWTRFTSPVDGLTAPVLSGASSTFSTSGVRAPVEGRTDTELLYAGFDGQTWRVGRAERAGTAVFAHQRVPTVRDTLTFETLIGEDGRAEIDLSQRIDGVSLPGFFGQDDQTNDGATSATYDPARGFVYVMQRSSSYIIVLDVRDDSTTGFRDLNYLDIEALVHVDTTVGGPTFRDAVVDGDRLWVAATNPEEVLAIDLTGVVDDDLKQVHRRLTVASLPMRDVTDDAGETTLSVQGPSGLALVPGTDLLIATHYRDNSASVFDLSLGAVGEEIAYLPDIGENPHAVAVAPDGTWAVVANYTGELTENLSQSTLVILDLDPLSPTYLEPTTWLVNQ